MMMMIGFGKFKREGQFDQILLLNKEAPQGMLLFKSLAKKD